MNILNDLNIECEQIYLKRIFDLDQDLKCKMALFSKMSDQLDRIEKEMADFFLSV